MFDDDEIHMPTTSDINKRSTIMNKYVDDEDEDEVDNPIMDDVDDNRPYYVEHDFDDEDDFNRRECFEVI